VVDVIGLANPRRETEKSAPRGFSLLRWFSLLSLATILVTGTALAWFLTRYLENHMLMRDAEVSREFIETIVRTENSLAFTDDQHYDWPAEVLDRFVGHVPRLPDVVRANIFATDRTVIWSTEERLIGRRFDHNRELERALQDEIMVSSGMTQGDERKPEHVGFDDEASPDSTRRFVEAYLPIRDAAGQRVVAVVEIYKLPKALFRAIDSGVHLVWASAATGGLVVYGTLFWIVHRADRIMRDQRERLVEAETLSTIGEMAAAVAHGIRNPLASIRSAAELAQEEDSDGRQDCLHDIMSQVDRLDGWVRELLIASQDGMLPVECIDLDAVIRESLDGAAAEMHRRGIQMTFRSAPLPPVRGTRAPLAHVIRSIVSNAIEAMPEGGHLQVDCRPCEHGEVQVVVEDSGVGMAHLASQRAFRPLFTTKPNGIGLGLSLSRRILHRHAGRIELASSEGRGTRVVMSLPGGA